MKPTITVTLSLPWGPEFRASKQLPEDLVRRTYAPIDLPSPTADPIVAAIFCTAPQHIGVVTKLRADIASTIGKEIAAALLEQMAGRDTIMGDPPSIRETPAQSGEQK